MPAPARITLTTEDIGAISNAVTTRIIKDEVLSPARVLIEAEARNGKYEVRVFVFTESGQNHIPVWERKSK